MDLNKSAMAEEATGCRESSGGLGTFYKGPVNVRGRVSGGGEPIAGPSGAYDFLRAGGCVEVPNAGAGSYDEFFSLLGFNRVLEVETGSSAGNWTLAVQDDKGNWHPAFQSNRYPRHGFEYSVDFERAFPSFSALVDYIQS